MIRTHISVFLTLGVIGVALIIWSGLRAYDAQRTNDHAQGQLRDDLKSARQKMDQGRVEQLWVGSR